MNTIKLKNKDSLEIIKEGNSKIQFKYKDLKGRTYELKFDLEDIQSSIKIIKSVEDFIKYSKNNIPQVVDDGNSHEKKLNFYYQGKRKLTIILKEITKNGDNTDEDDFLNKPGINPINNPLPDDNQIIKLKEKYEEKIKPLREENTKLKKINEELRKKIDEEKRKNDEIVKAYLENREKYEKAVGKNNNNNDL